MNKLDILLSCYSAGLPEFSDGEQTLIGTPDRTIGPGAICTSHADYIASRENGVVCGFFCSDNPCDMENLAEGHDFAVIDGRFIVDTWLFNWECRIDSPVLDMHDSAHQAIIAQWYGNSAKWVTRSPRAV